MQSSIDDFVKLIFFKAIFLIAFFQTIFSVSSTTRRNVFLNLVLFFDLEWSEIQSCMKVFVCIANSSFFVDKTFVLTTRLTYVCKAVLSKISLRIKSFSMFILFVVSEFKENWRFFFIENKIDDDSSFRFINEFCSTLNTWTWTRFIINLFTLFVIAFTIIDSFNS
jgi:hypothetical protein